MTRRRRNLLSSTGLVVYIVTMSFASFDWGMSLEPHWFSTIYGMHFVVGQALAAFAFVVLKAARLWRDEPVTFKGRYYACENARFGPKPAQRPRPPIWIAGRSQAALRRAVCPRRTTTPVARPVRRPG